MSIYSCCSFPARTLSKWKSTNKPLANTMCSNTALVSVSQMFLLKLAYIKCGASHLLNHQIFRNRFEQSQYFIFDLTNDIFAAFLCCFAKSTCNNLYTARINKVYIWYTIPFKSVGSVRVVFFCLFL